MTNHMDLQHVGTIEYEFRSVDARKFATNRHNSIDDRLNGIQVVGYWYIKLQRHRTKWSWHSLCVPKSNVFSYARPYPNRTDAFSPDLWMNRMSSLLCTAISIQTATFCIWIHELFTYKKMRNEYNSTGNLTAVYIATIGVA